MGRRAAAQEGAAAVAQRRPAWVARPLPLCEFARFWYKVGMSSDDTEGRPRAGGGSEEDEKPERAAEGVPEAEQLPEGGEGYPWRDGVGGDDEDARLARLFGETVVPAGGFGTEAEGDEGGEEQEGEGDPLDAIGGALPSRPYALVTDGTVEEGELVLHRDYESEQNHVMLFETLDDAYALAAEFKEATGKDAQPNPCDPRQLEERFHIRLFRPGGLIIDLSREAYLELTGLN